MSGEDRAFDAAAEALVASATRSAPIAERAVTAVQAILATYYPDDVDLIAAITYDETHPGLGITYDGRGPSTRGIVRVGRYYIDNLTADGLARRVLQLGHELEHVRQQRAGMGGAVNKHKREFLAFYWEAIAPEKPGTGKMPHATRVLLIDEALRNYYLLDAEERDVFAPQRDELLTLRVLEQKASGNPITDPPHANTSPGVGPLNESS